jgi:hypothetical protein
LTANEKYLEEKDKREKEIEKVSKIYNIFQGIAKNLCLSEVIKTLKIQYIDLKPEVCEFLCEGIISNKSLNTLIINHSLFKNESFEIFAKCLLMHPAIEMLEFSGDSLDDKCGNILGRIIVRQTQRRDQVIWMHGLRNERPLNNDYARGLISINLSNNQLADTSAEEISNALSYDSYIRSLDLRNNLISESGCKMFIKVLRKNLTVLNLDLRQNPGYRLDDNLHKRLVLKLSKNIKHLHNQHMEGIFNNEEYKNLKNFVKYEFFNVEVPHHIIEMYSVGNIESKIDARDDMSRGKEDKLNHRVREKNSSKEENCESQDNEDDKYKDNDISEHSDRRTPNCDEELLEENIEVIDENFNNFEENSILINGYNTDSNFIPIKSRDNKISSVQFDKLKLINQNLFHENLQLRKQILEMRALLLNNNNGIRECKNIILIYS